jgi:hypothetical protein
MQGANDRALLNLQRRVERQFFEGCRLDAATRHWVFQVHETVADIVSEGLAFAATFDVLSALNAGAVLLSMRFSSSSASFRCSRAA